MSSLTIPASWGRLATLSITGNTALTSLTVAASISSLTTAEVRDNKLSTLTLPRMLKLDSYILASNNALRDVSGLQATDINAQDQVVVLPPGVVDRPTAHGLKAWPGQSVAIAAQPRPNGAYTAVPTPGGVGFTRPGTHTHRFVSKGEAHSFSGTITQTVTGTALKTPTFKPADGFPTLTINAQQELVFQPGPMPAGTRVSLCEGGTNYAMCNFSNPASSFLRVMYQVPGQQPVTSKELWIETPYKNVVGDTIWNHPTRAEILELTPEGRRSLVLLPRAKALTAHYVPIQYKGWTNLKHIVQLRDLDGDRFADQLVVNSAGQMLLQKGGQLQAVGRGWQGMDTLTNAQHLNGTNTHFLLARRKSDGGLFRYSMTSTGALTGATQIGWHWNAMTSIVGVGDFDRDGIADVQAIRNDGTLWHYRGTRQGTLAPGKKVG